MEECHDATAAGGMGTCVTDDITNASMAGVLSNTDDVFSSTSDGVKDVAYDAVSGIVDTGDGAAESMSGCGDADDT